MKILVGYDGTRTAREALDLSVTHAKAFGGKVFVITSLIGGAEEKVDEIQKAENDLAFAKDLLNKNSIQCETHLLVRGLLPGEDIIQYVKENDIQEVILGLQKRSKVGKLLFGSTAQYVILNSPCPVVTVK
jgi:nucleotide-binding universal stress UspA family protein